MTQVHKVDLSKNSNDIGIIAKKSNAIVLDEHFISESDAISEGSIFIHIGTGAPTNTGYLVWENSKGEAQLATGLSTGLILPIQAIRILTSATFDGMTRNTTVTNLTWFGAQ